MPIVYHTTSRSIYNEDAYILINYKRTSTSNEKI